VTQFPDKQHNVCTQSLYSNYCHVHYHKTASQAGCGIIAKFIGGSCKIWAIARLGNLLRPSEVSPEVIFRTQPHRSTVIEFESKVMTLGRARLLSNYTMLQNDVSIKTLEKSKLELDLGFRVDDSLTFSEHIHKTSNKANGGVMAVIRRTFTTPWLQMFYLVIQVACQTTSWIWSASLVPI